MKRLVCSGSSLKTGDGNLGRWGRGKEDEVGPWGASIAPSTPSQRLSHYIVTASEVVCPSLSTVCSLRPGTVFVLLITGCKYLHRVCCLVGSFFLFFKFYWSIVYLQCCVNFFYTAKLIQLYIYICIYPFPLWFITVYWILFPVLYSRTLLFIHPIYNSLFSVSVSLFLFWK